MTKTTITHFWEAVNGEGSLTKTPLPLIEDSHILNITRLLQEAIYLRNERIIRPVGNFCGYNELFKERDIEWIELWIGRMNEEIRRRKLKIPKVDKHAYLNRLRDRIDRKTKYFKAEKRKKLR